MGKNALQIWWVGLS